MAGATAAKELCQKGFSVTIVEARDRIGGRIYTDRTSFAYPVDIGAGWIHIADGGNPITTLCEHYKVGTKQAEYHNEQVYWKDGRKISQKDNEEADHLYEKTMDKFEELRRTLKTDISLEEALEQVTKPMNLTSDQKLFLRYKIYSEIQCEWACPLKDMSSINFDEEAGDKYNGEDKMVTGGFDNIIYGLLSGLKIDLKLKQIVTEIDYS